MREIDRGRERREGGKKEEQLVRKTEGEGAERGTDKDRGRKSREGQKGGE